MGEIECPDCGGGITVTKSFDGTEDDPPTPLQGNWIKCEDCEYESVITIIQYPGHKYDAITEAVGVACGECGSDAMWTIEEYGGRRRHRCDGCTLEMYSSSFKRATIRLDKQ